MLRMFWVRKDAWNQCKTALWTFRSLKRWKQNVPFSDTVKAERNAQATALISKTPSVEYDEDPKGYFKWVPGGKKWRWVDVLSARIFSGGYWMRLRERMRTAKARRQLGGKTQLEIKTSSSEEMLMRACTL
jgi:hypothetical protein